MESAFSLVVHNDGPRIASTNFWDTIQYESSTSFAVSVNARCVRILIPRGLVKDVGEMATGKVAVLSIGPCAQYGCEMAHLMFDDGSNSPYCLLTQLEAFDVLPTTEDDSLTDLTCAVYVPADDLTPKVAFELPCRVRHTPTPNFAPVKMP